MYTHGPPFRRPVPLLYPSFVPFVSSLFTFWLRACSTLKETRFNWSNDDNGTWALNTFLVFSILIVLIFLHILLVSYLEAAWLSQVRSSRIWTRVVAARVFCLCLPPLPSPLLLDVVPNSKMLCSPRSHIASCVVLPTDLRLLIHARAALFFFVSWFCVEDMSPASGTNSSLVVAHGAMRALLTSVLRPAAWTATCHS